MAKIMREIAEDEICLRINDPRVLRDIKRMSKLNNCSIQSTILDIIYKYYGIERVKNYKEDNKSE